MKIGKTVLSAYSLILLLIVIGYSLINYQVLAGNGGWGIVGMFGLAGIGVALIVVDRVLVAIAKKPLWVNGLGIVIAIAVSILIIMDL